MSKDEDNKKDDPTDDARVDPNAPVGELLLEPAPGSPAAVIRALTRALTRELRADPVAFARAYLDRNHNTEINEALPEFELPGDRYAKPAAAPARPVISQALREQLAGPRVITIVRRWAADRDRGIDIGEGAGVLLDEILQTLGGLATAPREPPRFEAERDTGPAWDRHEAGLPPRPVVEVFVDITAHVSEETFLALDEALRRAADRFAGMRRTPQVEQEVTRTLRETVQNLLAQAAYAIPESDVAALRRYQPELYIPRPGDSPEVRWRTIPAVTDTTTRRP